MKNSLQMGKNVLLYIYNMLHLFLYQDLQIKKFIKKLIQTIIFKKIDSKILYE